MLEHGGRLRAAAQAHNIPLERWLDLSTGISPYAYPVPPLPTAVWQRLPEEDDGLEAAARDYYGAEALPVAGSQAAIQALPDLLPARRITLALPSYAEHAAAWQARIQHRCPAGDTEAIEQVLDDTDLLLLVSPNNPTGHRHPRERLLEWQRRLASRGGWLVVDEAFIDCAADGSLASAVEHAGNLVVLRSLGKFFGLAGARVGFVFAPAALRAAVAGKLGPWAVSGPARHAARAALSDRDWQQANSLRLASAAFALDEVLYAAGLPGGNGCPLFRWVPHPRAAELQHALARRGILVRHFPQPAGLRFGLPGDAAALARLAEALHELRPLIESPK